MITVPELTEAGLTQNNFPPSSSAVVAVDDDDDDDAIFKKKKIRNRININEFSIHNKYIVSFFNLN